MLLCSDITILILKTVSDTVPYNKLECIALAQLCVLEAHYEAVRVEIRQAHALRDLAVALIQRPPGHASPRFDGVSNVSSQKRFFELADAELIDLHR